MRTRPTTATLAAPALLGGAARVALGILWLLEGLLKYRAGFGAADIEFVIHGAATNSRVPGYFAAFADTVMRPAPALFGVAMPLLETALGVALILGVLTRAAALMSVLTLLLYWSADQLIWQYPVMLGLSVVVIAWPNAARALSVSALVERRIPCLRSAPAPLRVWL
ncbi:DoxX family protein [Leifsonia poae]|uniref:DoxX family protein n=1 Tax=Leifsonia poae TaxID=110933 RepID=UPI003D681176